MAPGFCMGESKPTTIRRWVPLAVPSCWDIRAPPSGREVPSAPRNLDLTEVVELHHLGERIREGPSRRPRGRSG